MLQAAAPLRVLFVAVACTLAVAGGTPGPLCAADVKGTADRPPVRRDTGIQTRVPWTTSRVRGTPDPPAAFTTEVAFPRLKFNEPLSVALVPGSDTFVVAERNGRLYAFAAERDAAEKSLVIDVGRTTYGIALHPSFAENGRLYVTYVLDAANPAENGSRLVEFTVPDREKLIAEPATERILLEWPSGGHNGGCLRFGPDGYLYLATGDASGIADTRLTGQDPSDLPGSILRIDVDARSDERPYAIPAGNPFVGRADVRPEVFSYGHRQVWKFSFDPQGRLLGGEVGQDLWEMILHIESGGNYGWSVMEGRHPFRPERPKGPTPIRPPLVEHPHSDFRSITGGYVSLSPRLPDLNGHYIYGDYDTGKVWALRYPPVPPLARGGPGGVDCDEHRELCDTQIRIVEFARDRSGDVYLVDFAGGQFHRLVPNPPVPPLTKGGRSEVPPLSKGGPERGVPPLTKGGPGGVAERVDFPRRLSETGLFASTKDHAPAPGVLPFSVNAPLWSDGGSKERFLALPGDSQIEFDAVTYPQPAPGAPPGWRFPDGTVLVKTFSLEMEAGNPRSRRRLETRLLHHERMPGNDDEYGAQVWRGYTYLWNDEQTDAVLLDAAGADRTYTIVDPATRGGTRRQTWHFPSRTECALCHNMAAKYALGATTLQMNRDHVYETPDGPVIANQLATFAHLGLFTAPLPEPRVKLPRLTPPFPPLPRGGEGGAAATLDQRARSYLHANCAHCHRKWGGGNAEFQLLATLPLGETGTLGVRPGQGDFQLEEPRLIVPGSPRRSMVHYRMTLPGLGRMPHIASHVIDRQAVELIEQWIGGMEGDKVTR
ncbi:MAG: PQQ-dependent sugar dehydrogenase [Planctomycetes bacterium]|nr:PQQ-dependent sugar dehydrogenase [Planctomycetota bacterium]